MDREESNILRDHIVFAAGEPVTLRANPSLKLKRKADGRWPQIGLNVSPHKETRRGNNAGSDAHKEGRP